MQMSHRKGELCLPSKHAGGEQQGRCIWGAVSHSIHCVLLSGKGAEREMRKLPLNLFYRLRSFVPAHSTPKGQERGPHYGVTWGRRWKFSGGTGIIIHKTAGMITHHRFTEPTVPLKTHFSSIALTLFIKPLFLVLSFADQDLNTC